jgi:hypothetical protein
MSSTRSSEARAEASDSDTEPPTTVPAEINVVERPEPPRPTPDELDENLTAACDAYETIIESGVCVTDCTDEHVDWFRALPDATYYAELNKFAEFDRTQFFDVNPFDPSDTHYYMVWNPAMKAYERCRGSVTGVTHEPFVHFDAPAHAQRIASENRAYGEYARMTKEQILHTWTYGANCGSAFHKGAELFLNTPLEIDDAVCTSPVFRSVEFGYFLRFVREHIIGKVDIVRTELRLTDWSLDRTATYVAAQLRAGTYYPRDPIMQQLLPMVKLAGSADMICHRRSSADPYALEIWDWKRSKKISDVAFGNRFGKWPCELMPDCNRSHYNLQLNLYKWMLQNNTPCRVTAMKIVVFHPTNDNYLLYEVPDLQPIIQRLMIQRLRKNLSYINTDVRPMTAENARYSAELEAYFESAPVDPADIWTASHAEVTRKRRNENSSTGIIEIDSDK